MTRPSNAIGEAVTIDQVKRFGSVEYRVTRVRNKSVADLVRVEAVTMDMPFHTSSVTLPLSVLMHFMVGRFEDDEEQEQGDGEGNELPY